MAVPASPAGGICAGAGGGLPSSSPVGGLPSAGGVVLMTPPQLIVPGLAAGGAPGGASGGLFPAAVSMCLYEPCKCGGACSSDSTRRASR